MGNNPPLLSAASSPGRYILDMKMQKYEVHILIESKLGKDAAYLLIGAFSGV